MKKTLFFLFLSQIIFAQKTYNFDYVLEYKTTKNDSIKVDLSYLMMKITGLPNHKTVWYGSENSLNG